MTMLDRAHRVIDIGGQIFAGAVLAWAVIALVF